LRKSTRKKCRL